VPYEVIVVDNGSKDESLDYLRSLSWIRLIERGDATPDNWVLAMATALDIGIREARGKYLLIMHTDVFFKREGWLRRLVDAIESDPKHAAAGTGKLETRSGLQRWLKDAFDTKRLKLWLRRSVLGDKSAIFLRRPNSPRDFCALYRLDVLRKHNLSFIQRGELSAGDTMYLHLVENGYTAAMIPVPEMMSYMDHIAHGTAGLKVGDRKLSHGHTQRKTERRVDEAFEQDYIKALQNDVSLDA
jgi:glycosyltransferase involved in cell wall biosynthesis